MSIWKGLIGLGIGMMGIGMLWKRKGKNSTAPLISYLPKSIQVLLMREQDHLKIKVLVTNTNNEKQSFSAEIFSQNGNPILKSTEMNFLNPNSGDPLKGRSISLGLKSETSPFTFSVSAFPLTGELTGKHNLEVKDMAFNNQILRLKNSIDSEKGIGEWASFEFVV